MSLIVDLEPIVEDILDENPRTGEKNWYKVWIREFSEKDVKARTKMLSAPTSTEDSRRGRQRRGQTNFHVERIRHFNFLNGVKKWDFVFPETYWDEVEETRKPHPRAGQVMPIDMDTFHLIPERIMSQIQDAINRVNEPPEIPEVRDEGGEVVQEAEESPTEESYDDRLESA